MRFLSLFSGCEGASLAWEPLGWECAAVAEIDKAACKLLAHRFPNVPNLGDVTKLDAFDIELLGHIDVVIMGAPCQSVSVAGKREGFFHEDGSATRSGLFHTGLKIARWSGARFIIYENVKGLFSSSNGRDFAGVVADMVGAGDFNPPKNRWGSAGAALGPAGMVEWRLLDSQFFGLAQRRERVFAILDTGDWSNRPPILLERGGLRRVAKKGQKKRKGDARNAAKSVGAESGGGAGRLVTYGMDSEKNTALELMGTLKANGNREIVAYAGSPTPVDVAATPVTKNRLDYETETFICVPILSNAIGRKDHNGPAGKAWSEDGICFTLDCQSQPHAVCYEARTWEEIAVSPTLDVKCQDGPRRNQGGVVVAEPVAFAQNTRDELREMPIVGALAANPGMKQTSYIRQGYSVRRLTPNECEALQGVPKDWTLVPGVSETARYKMLGNGFSVPVIRWIGERIELALVDGL